MIATANETIYEALDKSVRPTLMRYHTDLGYDKEAIEEHPGVPFLHWAGDSSTHIIMLVPESEYPKEGVEVEYLFGVADRHHILNGVQVMAKYFTNPCGGKTLHCHHYDGRKLRRITIEKAVEIAQDYCRQIEREWKQSR